MSTVKQVLYKLQSLSVLPVLALFLFACAGQPKISSLDDSSTLKALPKVRLPASEPVSMASLELVSKSYREALALVEDPEMVQDIMRRLALLELRQAEQTHLASTLPKPKEIYKNAIHTYETLLESQRERKDNDLLLYSLAKAKELSGNVDGSLQVHTRLVNEYPQSQYYSESQFRRGEFLFTEERYRMAANAYAAVITDADTRQEQRNPYLLNAHYMLGWSNFKLGNYDKAMRSFVTVLDDYNSKGDARKSLSEDTYRVMALSFSYRDGAGSIAALLDEVGERDYSDELYGQLAQLYLGKKRFIDSADVYGNFIARYPSSERAPEFQQLKIDAYIAGRFADKVREGKRVFAKTYAIEGEYWLSANNDTQVFIGEKLDTYITELAAYHHALAIKQKASTLEDGQSLALADIQQEFREAAYWYEEWIRSFPKSEAIASNYFLSGETRFEAGDYEQAVAAYEISAYSYPLFDKAAESGYAALISYDALIETVAVTGGYEIESEAQSIAEIGAGLDTGTAPSIEADTNTETELAIDWVGKKIESGLMFAEYFPTDTRCSPVLGQTVETLLSRHEYARTVEVSQLLLASQSLNAELQLIGHLSSAHAQKALQQYALAELGYRSALDVMSANPESDQYQQFYLATRENYAASIYKQGEIANNSGDARLAATQFMRVVELVPNSEIRVTAQHDAGVLLMQTEQWQQAIAVISDFEIRFPEHVGSRTASARLLQANQELENWPAAAAQAIAIYNNDPDAEAKRQALYLAAELYEKSDMNEQAIAAYRDYSHSYSSPLAERMEAQSKLVDLYEAQGEGGKRLFWVKQLVATHDSAQKKTQRSVYLAAFASAELAAIDWKTYQNVSLSHPLKKSLAKKRKAMDSAITSYQKVHDYGVAKYATLATQKTGEIYATFATALLDSERPKSLSELEREQYDMLLEEQAYPFEEEAIAFFIVNVERAWQGTRTEASKASYASLAKLLPGKYNKPEIRPQLSR